MCACGRLSCRSCNPRRDLPIGPAVRPRWVAPDTDYAPGLEVGDLVTVVITARVTRKKTQSAEWPTILDVAPLDDENGCDLRLWPDQSWRTTRESHDTSLVQLRDDVPVITITKES